MLGCGTVGSGVAQVLLEKRATIERLVGVPVSLVRVLVRDASRERPVRLGPAVLTTSSDDVIDDPAVSIVVEVLGGESPAYDLIQRAIRNGKHVVTANKEVMAKHGPAIFALAAEHGVDVFFEASVGGGIPLIAPFKHDLSVNSITSVQAIINGTTNYILTRMAAEGIEFATALAQAQALGYAEPDPTNDIEGHDARYKLAVLATLAFQVPVHPSQIYCEGISRIGARDFRYARELGYAIKLLAIGKLVGDGIEVRVHPALVPQSHPLASVDGVFNAVIVEGDLVGQVLFYGRGAGSLPTASAVVADVVELARAVHHRVPSTFRPRLNGGHAVLPMEAVRTRYYLRVTVADQPGVLAKMTQVLGDRAISIASVIQKESDEQAQRAELVIMTHSAGEQDVRAALAELAALNVVHEIGNFIRVEG